VIVSLEAVPRDRETLIAAVLAAKKYSPVSLINIPDLPRFSLRSWEACGVLREDPSFPAAPQGGLGLIPHIRAIDFDMALPFPQAGYFRDRGINKALVIAGDPPGAKSGAGKTGTRSGQTRPVYPTETAPFIRKLRAEMPELEIYAAFDPYRTNIRYELDYLKEKEDAGVAGFMSQPFFDLRLLEIYAEYLEGKNVFWGVSPALSETNRRYWESRNRAIFPRNFRPDMYWNVDFGRRVLCFCESHRFNIYLMPIKIDPAPYLQGLFG
jgi:methylenetetrahydrofolate reductase (NADPH)